MKIYLPRYRGRALEYLAEILRTLRYRVVTTANAQTALMTLKANARHLDLLLTDIVMHSNCGPASRCCT